VPRHIFPDGRFDDTGLADRAVRFGKGCNRQYSCGICREICGWAGVIFRLRNWLGKPRSRSLLNAIDHRPVFVRSTKTTCGKHVDTWPQAAVHKRRPARQSGFVLHARGDTDRPQNVGRLAECNPLVEGTRTKVSRAGIHGWLSPRLCAILPPSLETAYSKNTGIAFIKIGKSSM